MLFLFKRARAPALPPLRKRLGLLAVSDSSLLRYLHRNRTAAKSRLTKLEPTHQGRLFQSRICEGRFPAFVANFSFSVQEQKFASAWRWKRMADGVTPST
jgi:hypothetical protein